MKSRIQATRMCISSLRASAKFRWTGNRKNKRVGKIMDRKKLIPLFLSSAMLLLWACAEGDIMKADDSDEMIASKSDQNSKNAISDEEFLQPYLDYCNSKEGKKKGCEAEIIKSSSSKKDETALKKIQEKIDSTKKDYDKNVDEFLEPFIKYCNSKEGHKAGCDADDIMKISSSSKKSENKSSSSSKTSNSSSSTSANSSSSKGGTTSSSSVKGSSSSSTAKSASSSSVSSSSSKPLPVSGKCILDRPEKVYIGDIVTWSYLPDEGSQQTGNFIWEVSNEVEKGLVEGKLSGNGTPSIKVKYSTVGQKFGPDLTFAGKEIRCDDDFRVYQVEVEESFFGRRIIVFF